MGEYVYLDTLLRQRRHFACYLILSSYQPKAIYIDGFSFSFNVHNQHSRKQIMHDFNDYMRILSNLIRRMVFLITLQSLHMTYR